MKVKDKIIMPDLSHEQVENLVKFIEQLDIYSNVSEDGFCCTSDAIDATRGVIYNSIYKKYGMEYYLRSEDKAFKDEEYE